MSLVQKSYETATSNYVIWVFKKEDGEIWFKGKEVAKALGYDDEKKSIKRNVKSSNKIEWSKIGQNIKTPKSWHPATIFINKSGIDSLISISNKPQTEKFKEWFESEFKTTIKDDNLLVKRTFQIANDTFMILMITVNNVVWFKGKEIAEIMGYENERSAIINHVKEVDRIEWDKLCPYPSSNPVRKLSKTIHPSTLFINESGINSLVMNSKKPKALEFQHWVTSEVLPSIRKTGKYELPNTSASTSSSSNSTSAANFDPSGIMAALNQMMKQFQETNEIQMKQLQETNEKQQKMLMKKDSEVSKVMSALNDKEKNNREILDFTKREIALITEQKNKELIAITEQKNQELALITEQKNRELALINDQKNRELERKNEEFKSFVNEIKYVFHSKNEQISELKQRAVTYPENPKQDPYLAVVANEKSNEIFSICGQRDYVLNKKRKSDGHVFYYGKRPNPTLDWINITEKVKSSNDDIIVKRKKFNCNNKEKLNNIKNDVILHHLNVRKDSEETTGKELVIYKQF